MIHSAAAPNTAGGATGESFPNILAGCIPQARWSNRFTNQPPESSPRQGKDRWPAWVMESRPRQNGTQYYVPDAEKHLREHFLVTRASAHERTIGHERNMSQMAR